MTELDQTFEAAASTPAAIGKTMDELERSAKRGILLTALRQNRGNLCKTATALGVHRNTLTRNIDLLGLKEWPRRIRFDSKKPRNCTENR